MQIKDFSIEKKILISRVLESFRWDLNPIKAEIGK